MGKRSSSRSTGSRKAAYEPPVFPMPPPRVPQIAPVPDVVQVWRTPEQYLDLAELYRRDAAIQSGEAKKALLTKVEQFEKLAQQARKRTADKAQSEVDHFRKADPVGYELILQATKALSGESYAPWHFLLVRDIAAGFNHSSPKGRARPAGRVNNAVLKSFDGSIQKVLQHLENGPLLDLVFDGDANEQLFTVVVERVENPEVLGKPRSGIVKTPLTESGSVHRFMSDLRELRERVHSAQSSKPERLSTMGRSVLETSALIAMVLWQEIRVSHDEQPSAKFPGSSTRSAHEICEALWKAIGGKPHRPEAPDSRNGSDPKNEGKMATWREYLIAAKRHLDSRKTAILRNLVQRARPNPPGPGTNLSARHGWYATGGKRGSE